jgi:hypothetical protein
VFDRVHEDRLGVLNFLKQGEQPASKLATAAAAAADDAGTAAGLADGAAAGGARKVWDASRAAPKPALKHTGIGGVVSVKLLW